MSEPTIVIEDTVENIGPLESPLMILYHINLGFPIVDKGSKFLSSQTKVTPFGEDSNPGLEKYSSFGDPIPEAKNEVYIHDLKTDKEGNANAAIINPEFNKGEGIGVWLKYNKNNLPYFLQWKSYQYGEYVGGIIPANSLIRGRDIERKEGTLKFIKPGEKINYRLEFRILNSNNEIEKCREIFS